MPTTCARPWAILLAAVALFVSTSTLRAAEIQSSEVKAIAVHPEKVSLTGSDDAAQLIVTATLLDGRLVDLTHETQYTVADGKSAVVTAAGRVVPRENGTSEIVANFGGKSVR
ncbi:MAG: S-layer protein, partial [Planctomycetia bacterium]|nr:S-layer protein [Planctomycetia bacterium]